MVPAGWTTASLSDSSGNPISGASVVFRSSGGSVTNATTGPDGTAGVALAPGSYSVTMNYATGYQTKTITVTASGPNAVSFATVAVTAQINDPDSSDLAAASVAHAGNTGTFGPKTPVDGNGQVTFQVLPGTNTFTAWDANGYQTKTVTVTGPVTVTFATVTVTAQISDPDNTDLAAASVSHAGNTGTFGPKAAVDGNGRVTFQVLPGTNSFTAWDAYGYQTQTVTVTGSATVTFATVAVTVTVVKNGSPADHGIGGARGEHRDVRPQDLRRRQRPGHLPGTPRNEHVHRLGRQLLREGDAHHHRRDKQFHHSPLVRGCWGRAYIVAVPVMVADATSATRSSDIAEPPARMRAIVLYAGAHGEDGCQSDEDGYLLCRDLSSWQQIHLPHTSSTARSLRYARPGEIAPGRRNLCHIGGSGVTYWRGYITFSDVRSCVTRSPVVTPGGAVHRASQCRCQAVCGSCRCGKAGAIG